MGNRFRVIMKQNNNKEVAIMVVELKKAEFDAFSKKHKQNNFQQSSYWAKFMEQDGWHTYFVGYKDNTFIISGNSFRKKTLLLCTTWLFN